MEFTNKRAKNLKVGENVILGREEHSPAGNIERISRGPLGSVKLLVQIYCQHPGKCIYKYMKGKDLITTFTA